MIAITVRRMDGTVEIVKKDMPGMNEVLFEKMRAATAAAGRGELLGWKIVDTRTEAQKAEHDALNAEHARRVAAGWCDKCQSYCYGDCEAHR